MLVVRAAMGSWGTTKRNCNVQTHARGGKDDVFVVNSTLQNAICKLMLVVKTGIGLATSPL
eukprot:1161797-Pelagomonas_calceolata.AAC.10